MTVALIVPDPAAAGDDCSTELRATLLADGVEVRSGTAEQVLGGGHRGPELQLVLVHARLGREVVDELAAHFAGGGRPPAVVVFTGRDFSLLAGHVESGYDYLLPPFRPDLIRSRLDRRRPEADGQRMADLLHRERDLEVGREIQRGFLPVDMPHPKRWEVEARLRPADLVAGDFYDGFELANGNRTALLVADVCDKGVGAALFMALIRTLLRHTAQRSGAGTLLTSDLDVIAALDSGDARGETTPTAAPLLASGAAPLISAVRGTNDYLTSTHLHQGYFATVFFAVLDPATGVLAYINCGHNAPILLRTDGELVLLHPTGPAVGMAADAAFELRYVTLAEGETLLAYTDGVTEARDEDGLFFTERRLLELLRAPVRSATELLDRVDASVRNFVRSAAQHDDITTLALRRLPADPDTAPAAADGDGRTAGPDGAGPDGASAGRDGG